MGWQWVEDEDNLSSYADVVTQRCNRCPGQPVMTLLLDTYVCDVCDPPKTLAEATDFTSKEVVNRHVVSVTKKSGPYYLYSSKQRSTLTGCAGYNVYDDLDALEAKLLKKAASSGNNYYIYKIDDSAIGDISNWARDRGGGSYSTSQDVPNDYLFQINP